VGLGESREKMAFKGGRPKKLRKKGGCQAKIYGVIIN